MRRTPEPQSPDGAVIPDTFRSRWRYLPRLLRLLWELGPREVIAILAFALADGLMPLLGVVALRRFVDSAVALVAHRVALAVTALWLAALLAANLLRTLFTLARESVGENVQERLKVRAQERLLTKAGCLPLATFERSDFYDRLQRAQEGLDTRLVSVMQGLFPLPTHLLAGLGLLLYVGSANALFPLILLGGLVPSHILGRYFGRRRYLLTQQQTPERRMLNYLIRLMTARDTATEVRLYGLAEHLLAHHQGLFCRMRDARMALARAWFRLTVLPVIGEQFTCGVVVIGVVALIASRRLSLGCYASYLEAAERFRDAMLMFLVNFNNVDEHLRYVRDLFDYLDIAEREANDVPVGAGADRQGAAQATSLFVPGQTAVTGETSAAIPRRNIPEIRFEDVSFVYPGGDKPVLSGVTLTLRPGERIALVGENGAGKSTLARLLLGLYRPTSGRITADGADVQDLAPQVWRNRVAAVMQDYVKFQLTARDNIGFGDLARLHDDDALCVAAVRSAADAVIATLSDGYETPLGRIYEEAGRDLSIGQWQKLAIARAYLREADVLVLDEPTAALDARAEVQVYEQFRDMSAGRSVLLISHRLGSARLADRIVVLEHGRIVEEGSHAELMEQNGRYARMFSIQAGWYA